MTAIRRFRAGDEPALQAVFYSSVHTLAIHDYSPEQLDAWAPREVDVERWGERMRKIRPFVLEEQGRIVAYADLQEDGYIDHFYVAGDYGRRGAGRLLMDQIHQRAASMGLTVLFSNVSRTAQPFFERFGFRVIEPQTVIVRGVALANARMRKDLPAGDEAPARSP